MNEVKFTELMDLVTNEVELDFPVLSQNNASW